MAEGTYRVTIIREGQPAHQMAEMNATVSGSILLGLMRTVLDGATDGKTSSGLFALMGGEALDQYNFGTFKSLTITKLDDPDA